MISHAYIHIPFCLRKCHYCSFVSGFNISKKKQYIDALIVEIKERYKKDQLKTIYFGGGTPSLLEAEELSKILCCFNFDNTSEITIEINPETVTKEKIEKLKNIGFNRISLGVQTFENSLLQQIGRNHTEEKIYEAINIIKDADFKNISIDLIYGLPNQTLDGFIQDINKAIKLDVQHISSYGLKIEPDSYFGKNLPQNLPDDELQAQMFLELCKILKSNNFAHYEISNFSKKGYESQHNCSYWGNKNYYGFGLNASGYENDIRYRNCSKMEAYIKNPLIKEEEEELTSQETMENEIFLALRLKEGIDIKNLNAKYSINFEEKYKKILNKYIATNLIEIKNNHCKLTENGILLSNEIMSEFID